MKLRVQNWVRYLNNRPPEVKVGPSHIGPRGLFSPLFDCQNGGQKQGHVFVIHMGLWKHLLLPTWLLPTDSSSGRRCFHDICNKNTWKHLLPPPPPPPGCFWPWKHLLLHLRGVFDHENSSEQWGHVFVHENLCSNGEKHLETLLFILWLPSYIWLNVPTRFSWKHV